MTDMPPITWLEEPEIFDAMGFWQTAKSANLVEYTRTDIATANEKAAFVAGMREAAGLGEMKSFAVIGRLSQYQKGFIIGTNNFAAAIRAAADKREAGE